MLMFLTDYHQVNISVALLIVFYNGKKYSADIHTMDTPGRKRMLRYCKEDNLVEVQVVWMSQRQGGTE